MDGHTKSAFCLVRPPGHHAGPSGLEGAPSCGFCIFNSIAIGAAHALRVYGYRQNEQDRACKRVAILDFDIHHGNGTEAIVKRLAKQYPNQIFFCSIHLYDKSSTSRYSFYPGTFKLVNQRFSRGDISMNKIQNISRYTGTGKNDYMPSNVVNIALPPMWHNESLSRHQMDCILHNLSDVELSVEISHVLFPLLLSRILLISADSRYVETSETKNRQCDSAVGYGLERSGLQLVNREDSRCCQSML